MVIEFPWNMLIFLIFLVGFADVVYNIGMLVRWVYYKLVYGKGTW